MKALKILFAILRWTVVLAVGAVTMFAAWGLAILRVLAAALPDEDEGQWHFHSTEEDGCTVYGAPVATTDHTRPAAGGYWSKNPWY